MFPLHASTFSRWYPIDPLGESAFVGVPFYREETRRVIRYTRRANFKRGRGIPLPGGLLG